MPTCSAAHSLQDLHQILPMPQFPCPCPDHFSLPPIPGHHTCPRGASFCFWAAPKSPVSPPSSPTGNHETDNMNQIYGFEGEVKAKYTAQMFALFSEVFEWLPLAQCINGKVLVSAWQ